MLIEIWECIDFNCLLKKKNAFVKECFFQWSDYVVPNKAIRERPFCAVVLFSPKQKKKKNMNITINGDGEKIT